MSEPLVLGIESTCDETGVGLVRGTQLLVDRTATSMDEYARYGGIIPEIASRAHLESFLPTLNAALDEAGVPLADVDAIAVAAGPGLVGSLTVGICAAKALASSLGKPLYGVNHVIGHLAVDKLADGPLPEHFIGLVVSGGHSNILEIRNIATDVVELGGTLDDAAGEAFDKVGRLTSIACLNRAIVRRFVSRAVWLLARTRNATSTTSRSRALRPPLPAISRVLLPEVRSSARRTSARRSPRP